MPPELLLVRHCHDGHHLGRQGQSDIHTGIHVRGREASVRRVVCDETLIIDDSVLRAQTYVDAIIEVGSEHGLEINWKKLELMLFNCHPGITTAPGDTLHEKRSIQYLEPLLDSEDTLQSKLNKMLGAAASDFKALSTLWNHTSLSLSWKYRIFQACVVSKLFIIRTPDGSLHEETDPSIEWLPGAVPGILEPRVQSRCPLSVRRAPPEPTALATATQSFCKEIPLAEPRSCARLDIPGIIRYFDHLVCEQKAWTAKTGLADRNVQARCKHERQFTSNCHIDGKIWILQRFRGKILQ